MEETISSELKLSELSRKNFRKTIDQLHDRASSMLLLTLQWKDIEDHFDSTSNSIEERAKEVRSIEESVEQKLTEVKKRVEEFEVVKESVNVRFREVEAREKEFELIQKTEIQERKQRTEWIEKSRNEFQAARDLMEKKLKDVKDEFEREVNEKLKEIGAKEKQCERVLNALKVKEAELNEREQELLKRIEEFEEKQIIERKHAMDGNVRLCVTMDGEALQMFLNEHCDSHDLMRQPVAMALGQSSNPAKLVLDAIQGFYPPRLKKGDFEFGEVIVRKSCVILLEILMEIKPKILPQVKKEAMALSFHWMAQMKRDSEHSLEVLACLLLLAAYGLASAFDADELLSYLEIVAQHNQALQLLLVLGLADKKSDFLQNLIAKSKYVEAIKFIYAFELVNKFPPGPLLEKFLKDATSAINRSKMRDKSIEERIEATRKIVDSLRAALRCVEDYKIDSELSTKSLKQQIHCLENANANRKATLSASRGKSRPPCKEKKSFTSKVIAAAVCSPAPVASQKQNRNKRPWSAVSAKYDQNAPVYPDPAVTTIQMPSQQPVKLSANQDFIQGLIESNQRIEAIKHIHQSNMVDKFSPVGLLRDHLSYLKKNAWNFSKKESNSITAQVGSIAKEIAQLKAVINCIATYNLESEFSSEPEKLKERVAQLEKEIAEKNRELECSETNMGHCTSSKAKLLQQQKKMKNLSCNSNAAPADVSTPSPDTFSDPLKKVSSSSSVAASITGTNLSGNAAPASPIRITSPPPATVISAVTTTQVRSSSPTAASTAAPITVTPPPSTTKPSATPPRTKKPKQETDEKKHVFYKRPQIVSRKHVDAASPRPSGRVMYSGGPPNTMARYHIFAGYPHSNLHSDPYYDNIDRHYRSDTRAPSNSGYHSPMLFWRH